MRSWASGGRASSPSGHTISSEELGERGKEWVRGGSRRLQSGEIKKRVLGQDMGREA